MHLLPRDVKFFDQLMGQSQLALEAAGVLRNASQAGEPGLSGAWDQLKEIERKADEREHEVFRRIHNTFITPFDPEDIQAVASALDRIVNSIEAIGFRLHAFRFTNIPERIRQLAESLHECTKALHGIFETMKDKGLDKPEFLIEQCIKVNELENRSQSLAREGLVEAFSMVQDPVELIKLKDLYEHFEVAGDRCEAVANLMENVLAKAS